MLGIASHRGVTSNLSKGAVVVVDIPANAPGSMACRYTTLISSVPCLVRPQEKALLPDEKPAPLAVSDKGAIYLPADVPLVIVSGLSHLHVRSLAGDGTFCAAPMASM